MRVLWSRPDFFLQFYSLYATAAHGPTDSGVTRWGSHAQDAIPHHQVIHRMLF